MSINPQKKNAVLGRLALLGTTLIWGTSFVILKNALNDISTPYILAFRFSGAAILMLLLGGAELKKLDKSYFKCGAAMGVCLFLAYVLQTYGLVYTTPGKNAFLTAAYCVLVPFLGWAIYRKKPDRFNVSAALICIVGIGLVSLNDDLSVNVGDALTLGGAVFFALHIIVTSRSVAGRSVVLLTMLQFASAGVLSWIFALISGPLPEEVPTGSLTAIAYLCAMCTAVCFLLQTFGQKHTSPSSAAVILTLESVFGVVFSAIFYREALSVKLLCGFALIFIAVLISETKLDFLRRHPHPRGREEHPPAP